ncbi:MAG: hypothetical protein WBA54_03120 [Acidaminobacteraceae bacterium]
MNKKLTDYIKIDLKSIKLNANRYFYSLVVTSLYIFGFKASIYLAPALMLLFFSINSLIRAMYIQKNQIVNLEEIRDFEYSIIISQSSDDDLISSIEYYLDHYKKESSLYLEIKKLNTRLCNNGNLENEIVSMTISKELRSFLKVLSYTLSSGMDIKRVAILEYESLIKRVEAEKEIWASFSDKRLEIIIMIIMPPFIIYMAKIGMAANLQSADIFEVIISAVTILLICLSCKIIENIIGEEK